MCAALFFVFFFRDVLNGLGVYNGYRGGCKGGEVSASVFQICALRLREKGNECVGEHG